jgi:hypothetical protein
MKTLPSANHVREGLARVNNSSRVKVKRETPMISGVRSAERDTSTAAA